MKIYIVSALVAALNIPTGAFAFDMDCKAILCLAGGFPSGCADAKSYVFKRLRRGKPPFGVCTSDDGDYEVPVTFTSGLHTYYCPPPLLKYHNEGVGAQVVCAEKIIETCVNREQEYCSYEAINYEPADRIPFQLNFDIEDTFAGKTVTYYYAGNFNDLSLFGTEPIPGIFVFHPKHESGGTANDGR